jgi:hypothetical protein
MKKLFLNKLRKKTIIRIMLINYKKDKINFLQKDYLNIKNILNKFRKNSIKIILIKYKKKIIY